MKHQISAPRSTTRTTTRIVGICVIMLLAAFLAGASSASAASGTVSLTITIEGGLESFFGGGGAGDLQATSGAQSDLASFAPKLRQSLEGRYHPSEIERIVGAVTERAVIVLDGEAFSHDLSQATWLTTTDEGVYSL